MHKNLPINSSKDYIKECEHEMGKIEDEVHRIAVTSLPLYKDVVAFIGMEKSVDIAGLLMTIPDLNKGFRKLR